MYGSIFSGVSNKISTALWIVVAVGLVSVHVLEPAEPTLKSDNDESHRFIQRLKSMPLEKRQRLVERVTGKPDNYWLTQQWLEAIGIGEKDDLFIKQKWKENTPNLTVTLFGEVVGMLPNEPVYTKFYYPEVDFGQDDLRFASIRFMRKVREHKDRFMIRSEHFVKELVIGNLVDKCKELFNATRSQAFLCREIALDAYRNVADELEKHQEKILVGAASTGAFLALVATLSKTVLNANWRLRREFLPPAEDLELEPGTMVYAPVFPEPAPAQGQAQQNFLMAQHQRQQGGGMSLMGGGDRGHPAFGQGYGQQEPQEPQQTEPEWVLGEVQGRGVPGSVVNVMAYSNRAQLSVYFEDLRLARPEDQFLLAAMQGNTDTIMRSLETTGASVNCRDINGNTALMILTAQGNKAAMTALLEAGADPNMASIKGVTPLIIAAARGRTDVVNLLLDYGARPNKALPDGRTALFEAVSASRVEMAELLLDRGARPNQLNSAKVSPLYLAAEAGDAELVRLLISHGAGWTINVAPKFDNGPTPLFIAVQNNHFPVVQLLVEAGANVDRGLTHGTRASPLMLAASDGNAQMAAYLLEMGCNPDLKLPDGQTALIMASRAKIPHLAVAQILINSGADLDAVTYRGDTALHFAANKESPELVRMLIEAGADPNIQTLKKRVTPLLIAINKAIFLGDEPIEIIRLLLPKSKKSLLWCDRQGYNAFWRAAYMMGFRRNETEIFVDFLKAGGTDMYRVCMKTGSKRRPRPNNDILDVLDHVKRLDLKYLVKMWDPKKPKKIYEHLGRFNRWHRLARRSMHVAKTRVPFYEPAAYGGISEKTPLQEHTQIPMHLIEERAQQLLENTDESELSLSSNEIIAKKIKGYEPLATQLYPNLPSFLSRPKATREEELDYMHKHGIPRQYNLTTGELLDGLRKLDKDAPPEALPHMDEEMKKWFEDNGQEVRDGVIGSNAYEWVNKTDITRYDRFVMWMFKQISQRDPNDNRGALEE